MAFKKAYIVCGIITKDIMLKPFKSIPKAQNGLTKNRKDTNLRKSASNVFLFNLQSSIVNPDSMPNLSSGSIIS